MTDILDRLLKLEARINHLERLEPHVIACRIYKSTDFTHNSTGNFLAVEMPDERWDAAGMHSALSDPERITVPAAGWYYMWGNATFEANATGSRVLEIRQNGTAIGRARDNNPLASAITTLSISTIYYLAADDYVELYAYQNSGGNLAISAVANYSPEMAVIRLP